MAYKNEVGQVVLMVNLDLIVLKFENSFTPDKKIPEKIVNK